MTSIRDAILPATSARSADVSAALSPKQRALRALNAETAEIQKALNQAQSAIAHALRTIEIDYQKRRAFIINTRDEEPS